MAIVAVMKKGDTRPGPGAEQLAVLPLDHFEGADAAAYVHPDLARIFRCHIQAGLRYGELRRRQGKLDKAAHLLDFFALDVVFGVEILDFAGNSAAEARGIKKRDRPDPRLTLEQSLPRSFRSDPHGAYQTNPGHHHTTLLNDHPNKGAAFCP